MQDWETASWVDVTPCKRASAYADILCGKRPDRPLKKCLGHPESPSKADVDTIV